MNPFVFVLLVLLFVLLTPGVLLTLPKKGMNIWIIALTHGVIFAVVWLILYKSLKHSNYVYIHEGMDPTDMTTPPNISKKVTTPKPN